MDVCVNMTPCKEWNLAKQLCENFQVLNNYICVVLNTPINLPTPIVKQLWQNAKLRCTVDGGTNQWINFIKKHANIIDFKPPDFITGDFDSIKADNLQYFKSAQRIHTPNQNATDFTKAINVLEKHMQQTNNVIVLVENSGRLDQIIANINTLHHTQSDTTNIYLLNSNSITWLLRPGKHAISIPKHLVEKQRWCALMPIGRPAHNVSTSGLKWNLKNGTLEFGVLISTSNTYAEECVEITTDTNLLWSMGIFSDVDN